MFMSRQEFWKILVRVFKACFFMTCEKQCLLKDGRTKVIEDPMLFKTPLSAWPA